MSIRVVLSLLIGSIGLLLVGQSTRGVVRSYRRSEQAERIFALSQANAPLFSTVTGERTTRNIPGEILQADAPIDAALFAQVLDNRMHGHAEMTETIRRLSHIDQPGLLPVSRDLQDAEENYMALVPRIDAALKLPMRARDPGIPKLQADAQAHLAQAIRATNNFLESSMQMVDPLIDHLISLRQASRTLRGAAGTIISLIQTKIGSQHPFTLTDLDVLEGERVRIDIAWTRLFEAAARPDAPAALTDAITATQQRYFAFVAGPQASWIATLRGGQTLNMSAGEFQALTAAALAPIVGIADTAMQQLVARTQTFGGAARRNLLLNATALFCGIIFTTAGAMIAHYRVSGPLHSLTLAMQRLANGPITAPLPTLHHADELGEMSAALRVFQAEMLRAVELAELTTLQEQTEATQRDALAAEIVAMANTQGEVVETMVYGLMQLAEGDLSFTLPLELAPEYETLRIIFNQTVAGLQCTVRNVLQRSHAIGSGTRAIALAADDLAQRTSQQAARLRQTATAVADITATVQKTAAGTARAHALAAAAQTDAETSNAVVRETVQTMTEIDHSAQQIGQAIGLIDEIAFQTNLLALNAGVEAARSGEAGRGFAVVASEVRALAHRASIAATQVKALIENSSQHVARGVQLVDETGKALGRIQSEVFRINQAISEIAAAAAEQSTGLGSVNSAVIQMDRFTQQNANMVVKNTQSTRGLIGETEALALAVQRFRIGSSAQVFEAA